MQAEEELDQQRKSVAENGPHQQPSILSRVPRLAGCLGYQQARMTGCALQGVIFIPFAMLGAYRVVRAEGEPLGCAIQQLADTLRHAAQTAERALTPMYGPAVCRKKFLRSGGWRSCINVSGLRLERFVLLATMDISAHAVSLADRPRWAIGVTSVRMPREDRSSISFHLLADLGGEGFRSSFSWLLIRRWLIMPAQH